MTEQMTVWPTSRQEEEDAPTIHFVFSASGAGSLYQVLQQAGKGDLVLDCGDDYSFGPIAPPDPTARIQWMAEHVPLLSITPEEWSLPLDHEFWDTAMSVEGRRVVWMSRRSVREYSGFLQWVWRLGSESYDVVDITDTEACWQDDSGKVWREKVGGLGSFNPDHVDMLALLDQAKPLPRAQRDHYRDIWRRLRAENAALRVFDGTDLVSAPITHFDEVLMSLATDRWRKALSLIGDMLTKAGISFTLDVSFDLLHGRIRALVEQGCLEACRDPDDRWGGRVRLKSASG